MDCESSMYRSATNKNYRWRKVVTHLPDGTSTTTLEKYVWSQDFGPMQINDFYHKEEMAKRGMDINDWVDSLEFGFILLSREGTKPWSASAFCWNK